MNKKNLLFHLALIFIVVLALLLFLQGQVFAQNVNKSTITSDDILSSIRANSIDDFDRVLGIETTERARFHQELLMIFNDSESSNVRCAAAYYLGEEHVSGSVDALASDIKLHMVILTTDHLTMLHGAIAVDALVKIGNPSVPAVIRNLADSDDAKVRELSLQVLTRIDGDKDISQLRLQKALKAETNSQKQARLQTALKSLAELK